eukprot:TRINITY_DN4161_c0_g1_i4.p1 TRINITY_DN4161_c0_g1~~TRINITY_DN4161_c0_g1_i4.p1  ORF type:complete len:579 (-),score=52.44 TRINITY_DN4161_c0_g1_i4:1921-3657(-)
MTKSAPIHQEIASVFNAFVPKTQGKFRIRRLFGTQQFAHEALIALFEGLISKEEFEHVRNFFLKAHKLRTALEASHLSQQEYIAHAVTLFSDFIADQQHSTDNAFTHDNDTENTIQDNVASGKYQQLSVQLKKQQREHLTYQVELQQNEQENQIERHQTQPYKVSQQELHVEEMQQENQNRDNDNVSPIIQDTMATKNQQEQYQQQQNVEDGYKQNQRNSFDMNEDNTSLEIQGKSSEDGDDQDSGKYDISKDKDNDEVGEQTQVPDASPNMVNDSSSGTQSSVSSVGQHDPIIKFLSSKSPRERSIGKLRWDSEHIVPDATFDNNHIAKNYMRRLNSNVEETDSASNLSEPLSPAPSVNNFKEDNSGLLHVVNEDESESVLQQDQKEGRRPISPSPQSIRESMKSPTLSERSFQTQYSSVQRLSRKPTMVKDFGAKKRIENKKSGITGFQLAEDALNLYEEMRLHQTYKWLIMELNPVTHEIDVSNAGDAQSSFKDLVEQLPIYKCAYAAYNQGERSWGLMKIVFINWCPDGSPVKQRMIYASSKDFLKQFLGNVVLEIQATDHEDLDEAHVLSQIR